MTSDVVAILLGALAGGFVSGLTGFGTALTALPFWLMALSPVAAAQLAAAAGVVSQLQSIHSIWRSIRWLHVAPFIVPGLIGVPIGTALLPSISLAAFKLSVGVVLVGYTSFLLLKPARSPLTWGGRGADMAVGLGGGILGGLAGLSGPLPTIWAEIKGYAKNDRRILFQTFNLTILSVMLAVSAAAGLMTAEFLRALLISLPATILGARCGNWLYTRIDDRRFATVVLVLLLASGVSLIAGNL